MKTSKVGKVGLPPLFWFEARDLNESGQECLPS